MGPSSAGVRGQSRQRFSCCGLVCLFLLFSSVAFSQNPAQLQQVADAQKLETARETNDRIAQLALAESTQHTEYVIGSGDLLSIEVFDVAELSRDVRVSESGFVALPLVPVKVQASGLTPFQFQDKLAELLQVNGLVTRPQVTVTVKEQHSEPITVIGAVRNPLTIQAVHQMTLLQVLSQAGGISDDAGSKVLVTRKPRPAELDNTPGETPLAEMSKTQPANIPPG